MGLNSTGIFGETIALVRQVNVRIRQLYLPETNTLLTRFLAQEGVAETEALRADRARRSTTE
jgi:hypothetical protein